MPDSLDVVQQLNDSGALHNLSTPVQTALFLGALALLPAVLVCVTSFTRIIIVLSFVRRAVTSQDIPPNMVLIGLSLFLTLFTMGPTWDEISSQALVPYQNSKIGGVEALRRATGPLQKFMLRQTRRQDLALFLHMAGTEGLRRPEDTPFRVLVPAFVISELKTAFIMGFCIYVPFLLVDLVVTCVLTSMGMMMMPPVVISAPFKILLFVLGRRLAPGSPGVERELCVEWLAHGPAAFVWDGFVPCSRRGLRCRRYQRQERLDVHTTGRRNRSRPALHGLAAGAAGPGGEPAAGSAHRRFPDDYQHPGTDIDVCAAHHRGGRGHDRADAVGVQMAMHFTVRMLWMAAEVGR